MNMNRTWLFAIYVIMGALPGLLASGCNPTPRTPVDPAGDAGTSVPLADANSTPETSGDANQPNDPADASPDRPDPNDARIITTLSREDEPNATTEPIRLACKERWVELQILQGGKVVPRRGSTWTLKGKPFVFRLKGHVEDASFLPLTDADKLKPLELVARPMVTHEALGAAWKETDMHIPEELNLARKLFVATEESLREHGMGSDTKRGAELLELVCGQSPMLAGFGRYYFHWESKKELGEQGTEKTAVAEQLIDKIGGKDIAQAPDLQVALFLEKDLDDFFRHLCWKKLTIEFE